MDEKSRVAVVFCDSYDREKVYRAMRAGIDALGGIGHFVRPEERILVKPNFLTPSGPEKAVVTHPAVISGMLRILQEAGCGSVMCGDSPGHGTNEQAFRMIGLDNGLSGFGAVTADMSTEVSVDFPDGMTANQFYFTKAVTEADAIIGLSKMKTHMLERITGAVKNMYGLICGYRKAAGHVKYPNASVFARMLADIHRATPQRLHIMDGIVAMEGNGPGSGDPVSMNVLLFSADPVALDTVFCLLVNLDPELVPTNVQGDVMGIGTRNLDRIEIVEAVPGAGEEGAAEVGVTGACAAETGSADECAAETGSTGTCATETESTGTCAAETESADESTLEAGAMGAAASKAAAHTGLEKTAGGPDVFTLSPEELVRKYGKPDFDVDRKGVKRNILSSWSDTWTALAKRPYIDEKLCVRCGICTEHCPVPGKAVNFTRGREKPPVYDYKKCIRCYCCQEMCPQHAIRVRGRKLFRL